MEAEVRLGSVEDIDALEPLWIAMVEHHRELVAEQWPVRSGEEAWRLRRRQYQRWLEEETAILLVAQLGANGAPAGYLLCRLLESGPTFGLGPLRGEIDSLVVAAPARGAGLGTALLDATRQELQRREIGFWSIGVIEANREAIRLYERLGFRPWTQTLLARVDDPIRPPRG